MAADENSSREPVPHVIRATVAPELSDIVIAFGAWRGGTEALRTVLTGFPAADPGVVVVQHMAPGFTELLAVRLDWLCQMTVKQAKTGDRSQSGRVLIAPVDRHMVARLSGGTYEVGCRAGSTVCGR